MPPRILLFLEYWRRGFSHWSSPPGMGSSTGSCSPATYEGSAFSAQKRLNCHKYLHINWKEKKNIDILWHWAREKTNIKWTFIDLICRFFSNWNVKSKVRLTQDQGRSRIFQRRWYRTLFPLYFKSELYLITVLKKRIV